MWDWGNFVRKMGIFPEDKLSGKGNVRKTQRIPDKMWRRGDFVRKMGIFPDKWGRKVKNGVLLNLYNRCRIKVHNLPDFPGNGYRYHYGEECKKPTPERYSVFKETDINLFPKTEHHIEQREGYGST